MTLKKLRLCLLAASLAVVTACSTSPKDRNPAQSYVEPVPVPMEELNEMFINTAIYARHKRTVMLVATDSNNIASIVYCQTPALEPAKRLALHMVYNCLKDPASGFGAEKKTLEKINAVFPEMVDRANKAIQKNYIDEQKHKRLAEFHPHLEEAIGGLFVVVGAHTAISGFREAKNGSSRWHRLSGKVMGPAGSLMAATGILLLAVEYAANDRYEAKLKEQSLLPVDETLKQRFSLLMNEKKISVEAQREIIQELFSDSWLEERVMGLLDRAIRDSIKEATAT